MYEIDLATRGARSAAAEPCGACPRAKGGLKAGAGHAGQLWRRGWGRKRRNHTCGGRVKTLGGFAHRDREAAQRREESSQIARARRQLQEARVGQVRARKDGFLQPPSRIGEGGVRGRNVRFSSAQSQPGRTEVSVAPGWLASREPGSLPPQRRWRGRHRSCGGCTASTSLSESPGSARQSRQ